MYEKTFRITIELTVTSSNPLDQVSQQQVEQGVVRKLAYSKDLGLVVKPGSVRIAPEVSPVLLTRVLKVGKAYRALETVMLGQSAALETPSSVEVTMETNPVKEEKL